MRPFTHAALALLYIAFVASIVFYGEEITGPLPDKSILFPIAFLSLFVLSAAIMGYLFGLTPLRLYLDGRKEEAVAFFTRTILSFAALTLAVFATILLVSRV